jgi:SAM-dependent methyltransferase
MHSSSFENMLRCYERYVAGPFLERRDVVEVLDVGGADVNGSYRDLFSDPRIRYHATDLEESAGVEIVLGDPYRFPIADATFDIVLSGQMLEHCEFFWLTFTEMVRVLRPDGLLFLIAPSAGPVHRYPVDCYRFYPDAYSALARYAGCQLVEVWQDERGPWHDLAGVFRRTRSGPQIDEAPPGSRSVTALPAGESRANSRVLAPTAGPEARSTDPAAEAVAGHPAYRRVLEQLHEELVPSSYLEIGVWRGESLGLARCPAVGIDPRPELSVGLASDVRLFECTSDEFFERHAAGALRGPIDLAFIDGLHHFENALRDFMNVERRASPSGLGV